MDNHTTKEKFKEQEKTKEDYNDSLFLTAC